MTDLIQKQISVIVLMLCCGMTAGLVLDVFRLFKHRFFEGNKGFEITIGTLTAIVIAFLVSEYSFYCQNGKVTFDAALAFFGGLWLWYKKFYDIILTGECNEQKRKKTPRV